MTPHPDDTIAAVSSAPGPGLRAIVRVTGPKTREVIAAVFSEPVHPRRLTPGAVRLSGVHSPLPADLLFWPAPRTATGQDLAELHPVGSPPLVDRLVADLLAAGARAAQPGEFTLRAFLAGKKDLPQAEAVLAVIEAGTDADLRRALGQLAGGVTRPLAQIRDDLLNLLADVEAALDFADEDLEFVGKPDLIKRVGAGIAHLTNLRRQLDDRAVSGRPVRVAFVGPPNAGKSSLFNALAGADAALVSPTPGTTRDYLTRTVILDGVPVELIDTAGWESTTDAVAEQAQRLGREQAGRADVVVWCVPAGGPFDPADADRLRATGAAVLKAATKADLVSRARGRPGDRPTTARPPDDTSGPGTRQLPGHPVAHPPGSPVACSTLPPGDTAALRAALTHCVSSLARPPLAPSLSRCRGHVDRAVTQLREAHRHVVFDDPPEIVASALRAALDQIGELAGAVYTPDLLDRIFSRFCIGK
jgi:tRNA modification GTPase